ncbi:protein DEHYDRATION-INDUCED 19 homolog 6-like isoform X2 [Carica papaya]|uniref:protein DEHYDRATION-INDUCED 19 homolog 6-like isoform X2 n=1 Tax=Carica papaya TaxID=3649 RepID=UPI000B8CBFFC|nr:protein DEHYDRATION-INDUCED 19 homolog 6-like isoform X2 [Carica papaya]
MSNGDEVLDRNWPTEDFVDVDERISNLQQSVDCLEALVLHISNANLQVSSNSFTFSETSSQLDSDTESDDTESSGVSEDEDVDESDYSQKSEDSRESDSENGSDEESVLEDSEGDDDARACFPCPFCYVDIEVHLLCGHLQEEHCFDLKNSVCPLCAANLGRDVLGHFIVQHASSLKRRRRSQKLGHLTGSSAMLGRELISFLGSSTNAGGSLRGTIPDPVLSPFFCSASFTGPNGFQPEDYCSDKVSGFFEVKSSEHSFLDEVHEQDKEERRKRAAFVQQLILSTIF